MAPGVPDFSGEICPAILEVFEWSSTSLLPARELEHFRNSLQLRYGHQHPRMAVSSD